MACKRSFFRWRLVNCPFLLRFVVLCFIQLYHFSFFLFFFSQKISVNAQLLSPLFFEEIAAHKNMHQNTELQIRGRRCSRRMAHSDQPPPARRGQSVPNVFADSVDSYRFADSKASPGHRLLPPTFSYPRLFGTNSILGHSIACYSLYDQMN